MEIALLLTLLGSLFLYIIFVRKDNTLQQNEKRQDMSSFGAKNVHVLPSFLIYVGTSHIPDAGRGVFARVAIKKNQVIESCPTVTLSIWERLFSNQTIFRNYVFSWKREGVALCFGYGSLYNYSKIPNADWRTFPDKNVIEFFALKNIKKDEEITINYGWNPERKSD